MPRPNDAQLDLLRTKRQRTKMHLGIYEPQTVLKAQINNIGAAQGDYEIVFDGVTEGSTDLIIAGQTMYVGSSEGRKNLGRVRVRSVTGSTITVAENDHIQWEDDAYIWIVRFWEPWAVYPRIVLDGNNVPTFYKDYDIVYSGQNLNMDPVVNMGPHTAAFLETGVAIHLDYSSSGSFGPSDSALSAYDWWFEGGTPTGSSEAHPSGIAYEEPGHYTTHLKITDAAGKDFTGHRHVQIYDKPGLGTNPPIQKWGLTALEGNRSNGGWSGRFWVREEADLDKIIDGALVVLFTEDWFDGVKGSMGGNAYDRASVFFVGYIEGESIRYNSFTSRLEFRIVNLTILSDLKNTFSATLETKTGPSYWYEMEDLTLDKGIIHFLRWQTTLLSIADFARTGYDAPVQYIDFSRGTIFSEIDGLLESARGAKFVSDRQGKMWTQLDVNLTTTGTRTQALYPDIIDITRDDWQDDFDMDREYLERLSYLEAGGIAYSGAITGTFEPYIGGAPGDAPAYAGGVQRKTGLILASQQDVNEYAGLGLAKMNATYPRVTFAFTNDYRFVDIAPQEFVRVTVEAEDTFRDIVWDKKRFVPEQMSIRYKAKEELLLYDITLAEETNGPPGETVVIPVDPPYDPPDLPYWDIDLPPIQPFPSFPPIIEPPPGTGELVYFCWENRLARTRNFWAVDPDWESVAVPADMGVGFFNGFRLDPKDPQNSAFILGYDEIWKTSNLDSVSPSWSLVYSDALYPGHHLSYIRHIAPWIMGRGWSVAAFKYGAATGCPSPWQGCRYHLRGDASGTTWEDTLSSLGVLGSADMIQPSTYAGGVAYYAGDYQLYQTKDGGIVWNEKYSSPPYPIYPQPLAHLGNSQGDIVYLMAAIASPPGESRFYVSTDGGLTRQGISAIYDGTTWFPAGKTAANSGQSAENFWIHPKTGVGYAALRGNGKSYGIFGQYANGAWLIRARFTAVIGPMAINFSDDGAQQYLMGGTTNEHMMGSEDHGATWFSKEGDFEVAVQSFISLGNRTAVQPVWTV